MVPAIGPDYRNGVRRTPELPGSYPASVRTWFPAATIGLLLGNLALSFPPLGIPLAPIVAIGLGVVYWRQARLRDIGWLFVGIGSYPTAMLGRALYADLADPAVRTVGITWLAFAAFATSLATGLAIVVLGGARGRR